MNIQDVIKWLQANEVDGETMQNIIQINNTMLCQSFYYWFIYLITSTLDRFR